MLGQRMSPRIWGEDLDSPTMLNYYVDHPPLVPLLVSFNYRIFGISEASTRLVAITFSLLSLFFVYLIALKLFDPDTALLAVSLLTLTPMFLFFGRMTNHEVVTNFFVLAAIYAYMLWVDARIAKNFALLLLALIFGMAAGWPAYYVAGLLSAHCLFFVRDGRKGNVSMIVALPVVAVLMFGLFIYHVYLLEGMEGLTSLMDKFLLRAGGGFRWTEFIATLARYFDYGFTPVLILLAFLYAAIDPARSRESGTVFRLTDSILLLMFGFASIHVLLFKQAALEHPYWIFYFIAPIAICAARAVYILANPKNQNAKVFAAGVYAFFLVLLVWLSYPRMKYFNTANRVHAYRLGQSIHQHSSPGDIIVMPLGYQGTQLPYYADRDVRYWITTLAALDDILANRRVNYRYYFMPKGEVVEDRLQEFLRNNYAATSWDGDVFYDLHSQRR